MIPTPWWRMRMICLWLGLPRGQQQRLTSCNQLHEVIMISCSFHTFRKSTLPKIARTVLRPPSGRPGGFRNNPAGDPDSFGTLLQPLL